MSTSRECPSVEQLKQLAVGRLPDPPAGELEQHLLECEACARQTAELHQTDTLMAAMQRAGRSSKERPPEEQARLERLVSTLSGLHARQVDATMLTPAPGPQVAFHESDEVTRELSAAWRPAQGADEIGRLGGYRILKLLGVGGMGGVFLAEDMQLRRRVALKLMRPRAAAAPGAAERFLREARAAAALRHDHIITIYQVGEEVGVPFLAMELLEGESLADRLRRESLLPMADVLRIGREIAEGLAAAHAKGLIHRDIKPANVWLESSRLAPRDEARAQNSAAKESSANDSASSAHALRLAERDGDLGRVKLLDFGLARSTEAESQLTSSGMIVGTPSYMAPEQASGDAVDHRADLFSLGVVLYRMTTGQLPFPGERVMEILKSLVTVTPASPSSINPAVPRELSDLIDRLLAKEAQARPESARAVVRQLAEIEARRMAALGRPALESKVAQKARRPRAAILRIALGLAAAMVLLAVVVVKIKTKDGKETEVAINVPGEVESATVGVRPDPAKGTAREPPVATGASPLDALDPANIPERERFDWQPKELVAVLGGHAWRHWGDVLSVSINPDGSLVASAGQYDGVRVWEAATGKQLANWPGSCVAFTSDGNRLVIGGDAALMIVDVKSRETRTTFKSVGHTFAIGLSSDANTLAAWSGEVIQVFDVAANKERLSIQLRDLTKDIRGIALSANGKTLAAACHEGLKLWDVETGQSVAAPDIKNIPCVAISPDSSTVATQAETGEIQLWNLQSGRVEGSFVASHPHHRSRCLAFSRDGKTLVSAGSAGVYTWDVTARQAKEVFMGHHSVVNSVGFTADGQTLVSGGGDAAIRLWNATTAKQLNAIQGYPNQVSLLALTPDGRTLAVAGKGNGGMQVVLWDLLTSRERAAWEADENIYGLAIRKDGTTLATAGFGGVQLWDLPTGEKQPPLQDTPPRALDVKFAPDGTTISALSAPSQGNEVRSWQLSTGKLTSSFRVGDQTGYVSFEQSPDGALFAYCDSNLQVWDVATQKQRFEVSQTNNHFWSPVFSRDGTRLLVVRIGDGNTAPTVYDTTTGKLLEAYLGGHPFGLYNHDAPTCAIFLRDDKTIVSAGQDGQIVEWTSPRKRKVVCRLPGPVLNLALAEDGRHLFTANSNGTVYILRLNQAVTK